MSPDEGGRDPRRARRIRSSTPTGTSSSSRRCSTRRCSPTSRRWAAARCATGTRATRGSPTRRPCSPVTRHPIGPGWKAMPSWWGWATQERARPRDGAPARAAVRTARRDRHRLHDPVSVDDARRTSRSPTTSSSACGAAPRTARSPNLFARYRDRTTVGALVPMLDPKLAVDELEYAVHELGFKTAVFAGHARRPIGSRRRRTGSTRSASTARTTTTRCGPSASSSASRRCSTARCSRTG